MVPRHFRRIAVLACALIGLVASPASAQVEGRNSLFRESPERFGFRLPRSIGDHAQPPLYARPNGPGGPAWGLRPGIVRHAYGFDALANQMG